jgi:hypothetical protein
MEHSVHLATGKFIEGMSPASGKKIITKIRNAIKKAKNDQDTLDLDELDTELAHLNLDDVNDPADNDSDDNDNFTPGDIVGKALALVRQIRKSSQARAFFKKSCAEVEIPFLQLLNWICTRWASLFNFLDRILKVQKVSCHLLASSTYSICLA